MECITYVPKDITLSSSENGRCENCSELVSVATELLSKLDEFKCVDEEVNSWVAERKFYLNLHLKHWKKVSDYADKTGKIEKIKIVIQILKNDLHIFIMIVELFFNLFNF